MATFEMSLSGARWDPGVVDKPSDASVARLSAIMLRLAVRRWAGADLILGFFTPSKPCGFAAVGSFVAFRLRESEPWALPDLSVFCKVFQLLDRVPSCIVRRAHELMVVVVMGPDHAVGQTS